MADIKTYKSTLTGHQLDEALAKLGQVDSAVQQSEAAAAQAQGYADSINPAGFATASQGKKADTAVQPSDVLNLVYPVGAIYISCNSTGPATLFGGTWEQIQGRFLLASSESYPAGSTGGEVTVTLTENQIPSHTHAIGKNGEMFFYMGGSAGEGTAGFEVGRMWENVNKGRAYTTSIIGGGQSHNNMPPYLAVYMWQRTA